MKNAAHDPARVGERNDCAVVATANVLGIPYSDAHDLLAKYGRKIRQGTKDYVSEGALQEAAATCTTERPSVPAVSTGFFNRTNRPTVAQLERSLPKDQRFWISAGGHAFAYVNGVHLDNLSEPRMRSRVKYFHRITLKPKSPLTQEQVSELWARLDKLEGRGS